MYAQQSQGGPQQQYSQPGTNGGAFASQLANTFGSQQLGFQTGAYGQQQGQGPGQAVNAGNMFAGQAGGNGAGGQAYGHSRGQSFAPPNAFATGGTSNAPYGAGSPAVSTSNLLQQQLAAQQAAFSQNPSAQPNLAQQQYMQSMQQQQMYQQAQNAQQQSSPFANPSLPASSQPLPPPTQASPPAPAQQRPPGQTMTQQEIQNALRGVNLNGMTQERFQQLTPVQQTAIREVMMSRSRAQQQASLGLGMPGAAATPPRSAQPQPNGLPTPVAGGTPSTPAGPVPNAPQTNVFLKTLTEFFAKRGVPFAGPPVVEGRTIDLARMFAAVTQGGGFNSVRDSDSVSERQS